MIEKVRKRDGRIVDFDKSKIANAIFKAARAVGGKDYKKACELADKVVRFLEEKIKKGEIPEIPSVEQIQDAVEKILVEEGHYKTAKAYILYRKQHEDMRKFADLISNIDLVDLYIFQKDWRVKENANMTYSLQGLNFHISSIIVSQYWLNKIYPPEIRNAHTEGDFHIHDLGFLGPYCVGWDLYDLLVNGFKGVRGKIESKPAKHFRSALGQIVNFFYTLQGEAAGAQALSNLDTYLAPFIRYDNLTYKDVKQAIQEFLFNMNIPTRVGFQTPFTNVTLDLKVPKFLENEPVIIGGKPQKDCYGDFQDEVEMFNKAFVEVMLEGDAKGRVFTFPIPTYNITKDFDWENENYEKIWEIAAKYGIPYFANFINSDMSPEDVRSMCCRLRLDLREVKKRGGGLFGSNPLTGSIGVVTLNMPRLGYLSKDESDFFERLQDLMELAKNSLEIKRKFIERLTEKGLYPYSKFYLRNIKARFGEYWKNHFSTIGLVGMNECCLNLFGKDIGSKEGLKFAEKVLDFMVKISLEYQEETGNLYNIEATPAESTSYRLARLDLKKYPDIIFANDVEVKTKGAQPYYTNSTNLPVYYTDDLIFALKHQERLQTKYTGGTVFHIFLGESTEPQSVKILVRKIFEKTRLPYITITPTFSVCPNHGYLKGKQETCPKCNSKCEIYSRIVGYIRPVENWNEGKKEEFKQRKTFDTSLKAVSVWK
ncbi:MAG TPA: ribonucleoside triphosphate reductase [Nanoarchaeota archaeon]|nr:ribonucleoside triphosphate reductase [Nanoarchaeota archaeon]